MWTTGEARGRKKRRGEGSGARGARAEKTSKRKEERDEGRRKARDMQNMQRGWKQATRAQGAASCHEQYDKSSLEQKNDKYV